MRGLVLFSLLLLVSALGRAEIRFYRLSSPDLQAPILLPAQAQESGPEAWSRYLRMLEKTPDMIDLFQGQTPQLSSMKFTALTTQDLNSVSLMIMNKVVDYGQNSPRIREFRSRIEANSKGLEAYLLPMAADLGMGRAGTTELRQQIAKQVPLLIAMGGDDTDPRHAKSENIWSENTNYTRDMFEIGIIQNFVKEKRGFLLGVCRGMQISAVALGYKLNQHVPFHIGETVAHKDNQHEVQILSTEHNHLKNLIGSGTIEETNSLHHQSVRYVPGGILKLAAKTKDGVTEALEFSHGLLLQFHPEFMNTSFSKKIFSFVSERAAKNIRRSCRASL